MTPLSLGPRGGHLEVQPLENGAEILRGDRAREQHDQEHLEQDDEVLSRRIEARERQAASRRARSQQALEPLCRGAQGRHIPAQLGCLARRHEAHRERRQQRHGIRLPARDEDRADDRQGEDGEEQRTLQAAGVLPDECHNQDTKRVQRCERAPSPQAIGAGARRHGSEGDVDGAESEEAGGHGNEVDRQAADQPRQRHREQDREYGQEPGVIEQMYAWVMPRQGRQDLGGLRVHGCLAGLRTSPDATRVPSERKLLPSRKGRDSTFWPPGG